eukprot:CAMPEP_0184291630 /NCGR_PEP_ID=MMETSP1049-20130417/3592_1 /TAXON_ID=77928 /ORGANISM="Proteomonas sulcata, Strain CCMP704" /LENGTH=408 /DNA_ID=CAMNT_0026599127 /DNA_START=57 /DNA_END=1284 /DNA_ORIENTATION=-
MSRKAHSVLELDLESAISRSPSVDLTDEESGIVPPSPNDHPEGFRIQRHLGAVTPAVPSVPENEHAEQAEDQSPAKRSELPRDGVLERIKEVVGSEDSPVGTDLLAKKMARRMRKKSPMKILISDAGQGSVEETESPEQVPMYTSVRERLQSELDGTPVSQSECSEESPAQTGSLEDFVARHEVRRRYNRQVFSPSMGFTAQEVTAFRNGNFRMTRRTYNYQVHSPSMGQSPEDLFLARAFAGTRKPVPSGPKIQSSFEDLRVDQKQLYNAMTHSPSMGIEEEQKQQLSFANMLQDRTVHAAGEKICSNMSVPENCPVVLEDALGILLSDQLMVSPQQLYNVEEEEIVPVLPAPSLFSSPGLLGMLLGGGSYVFAKALEKAEATPVRHTCTAHFTPPMPLVYKASTEL